MEEEAPEEEEADEEAPVMSLIRTWRISRSTDFIIDSLRAVAEAGVLKDGILSKSSRRLDLGVAFVSGSFKYSRAA